VRRLAHGLGGGVRNTVFLTPPAIVRSRLENVLEDALEAIP